MEKNEKKVSKIIEVVYNDAHIDIFLHTHSLIASPLYKKWLYINFGGSKFALCWSQSHFLIFPVKIKYLY